MEPLLILKRALLDVVSFFFTLGCASFMLYFGYEIRGMVKANLKGLNAWDRWVSRIQCNPQFLILQFAAVMTFFGTGYYDMFTDSRHQPGVILQRGIFLFVASLLLLEIGSLVRVLTEKPAKHAMRDGSQQPYAENDEDTPF